MIDFETFVKGMMMDYKAVWQEYPATLVWTAILALVVGAVVF